ncbi:MAG: ABC transporter substrate-binding protein [Leptolyngbyaceae cyanobacterium]
MSNLAAGFRLLQQIRQRGVLFGMIVAIATALTIVGMSQFTPAQISPSQIVFSALSDPRTFNPALSQEYPNVFLYTFQGLITLDGETGEIVPALAESWDISEDGLTYVFTLRDGLQWSDGELLTADDVVFTYQEVTLNEAIPAPSRDIFRIGVERLLPTTQKLDDRRVQFNLPEPFAPFLRNTGLQILPAHSLQEAVSTFDSEGNSLFLSTWTTVTPPAEIVCNGPYRLKEYLPAQHVIFERNPYYWRHDDQGNQQPYIQELEWRVINSSSERLSQFRAGELDLIGISPNEFATMKQAETEENFTIYNGGPALGTTFITFNLNKASRDGQPLVDPIKSRWFNSVAFRKAVYHAIDRPNMINTIYQGLGEPQLSPLPVQSPFYAGPEEGIPTYEYNLEKARSLLEAEGFQYNSEDQLLDADGNRVRFTLITNSGNWVREAISAQIQQDLAQIGIQVDFQPISFNALVARLADTLDWEAVMLGFTAGLEPNGAATVWLLDGILHTFNQQADVGQPPLEGWEAAEWEQAIADIYIQAAQELDEAKRYELYRESQRLTQEYLPFIYLVNPLNLGAVRNTIQGVKYSGFVRPYDLWNVYELKIDPNNIDPNLDARGQN